MGYSLIWPIRVGTSYMIIIMYLNIPIIIVYEVPTPIRGCAAGKGMVFVLSVLNRVYNFARLCPKQGIQFRASPS